MESPLLEIHQSLNAKLGDFAGWAMPLEYPAPVGGGTLTEHEAVRTNVGIFDVSHLGKIEINGAGAKDWLNSIITNDLNKILPGQAQYSMLCHDNGGVIDDLIVYLKSNDAILIIPNAANSADVFSALNSKIPQGIKIQNRHNDFAVIALQGPASSQVLAAAGLPVELNYMSFTQVQFLDEQMIICRTGYSGEHGYELLPTSVNAAKLWEVLSKEVLSHDGRICGLGARDTLRTEMGYPLHGHELSLEISPVTAGSSWAVGWQKDTFAGSAQLREEKGKGSVRILRGLLADEKGIPRAGMQVKNSLGNVIGEVTSGTFSPTLKNGIALALIDSAIGIGEQVLVDIRGRNLAMSITKLPFVPSHVR
ncbi:MAG: glycine cleavage system aminomethyltransferase GcvT [Actinobacteria bacterium]|uniref:aminomethyltransferase n=1 Tax=freshwater metagenome TaxID=449393 RepID=A0A6J6NJJ6_9ZZZZ|nr:glycine cleavage system aminomethyltransferase GcvT [Actinomycetota bacterium]MSY04950.1 glycine cleavage system aminomethyltransferase GcvT [Actinomycetota bacterium]MSY67578.1 glycine cleavage system aminomethyltransferase GcvT [Actinomycetota bacterium]MSZ58937.1 glycine cleavage system aminomethyltransferase GcvT [Actinomycetota bacterium]MTA01168.1 glycine cleavage system aminomethyltransferase GcvT [Actinomycetota bacterium]